MGIIVVRPAGWGANSSQSCRSCSFKSFDVRARFGTIDSASKTKKYLLKNSTIRNRLLFPELQTLNLLVPKIRTGGSFYLIVIYFWNSKTISQLNFERLLVTDFCSNDFSEIPLAYLLYQLKPIPEISVKNISKIFYQTRFSLNSRVLLSANFSRNIYHQWNRNISYYYRMTSVVLRNGFAAIALKMKML